MEARCCRSRIGFCSLRILSISRCWPWLSILVDSNLLVLLVVGRVDRSLIGRHRRLKQFTAADYDRLIETLANAERILVTPNTLTESSNLLAYQRGRSGATLVAELQTLIEQEIEVVVLSIDAAKRREFRRLGLTDAALIDAASAERPSLTADLKLYGAALAADAESAVLFRPPQADEG